MSEWIERKTEDMQGARFWRWPREPGAVLEGICLGRRVVNTRFGPRPVYDFESGDGRVVGLFATGRLDRVLSALLSERGDGIELRVRFTGWTDTEQGRRREFSVAYRAE